MSIGDYVSMALSGLSSYVNEVLDNPLNMRVDMPENEETLDNKVAWEASVGIKCEDGPIIYKFPTGERRSYVEDSA